MMIVFGCVIMIVSLIVFGIVIEQLDTSITTTSALIHVTDMQGLTSIMPLWGMIIFMLFVTGGLASLIGGAVLTIKSRYGGGWMDTVMLAITGGISTLVAIVCYGLAITQLDTAMTTVNATTNTLTGTYDIMGVFGMVIFIAFMGAGLSMIVAAGVSGFQAVKSKF